MWNALWRRLRRGAGHRPGPVFALAARGRPPGAAEDAPAGGAGWILR
ncbi:hypothetical protein [Rubellimicrobium roseum]|nr:hypothetical protein [Rubellimicrobium roseum]